MSDTDIDDTFRAQVRPLISRLLHNGAYHPLQAAAQARELGELLCTRPRIEYACFAIASICAAAARSLGNQVNFAPGTIDEDGHLVAGDIDDAEPTQRAAVRFMRCADTQDVVTGMAVFNTVPTDELAPFVRSILGATINVIRTAGWGAHL